ncbi:D(1A) dopamine receptor-like [Patiria miniata]|uniref:G-protein coupled receptors family 1 profile domain-containing protein n=1 Tax=Patiria miniata TaxID=46514 RepID=A0A914ALL5_PATMI|nr:D(1A) dopamine receptor-like [Patiria miniata]
MESATVDPDITSPRQTDPDTSPIMIVVFCVILAVLGLASVLGNVVVLGTLRHAWATVGAKPGNFLAFMLAVADLLNTLINLPMVVAGVFYGKWHVVDLSMAHFFFLILLSGASNMLLCVIAINRYAVVSKPNTSEKVGRRRAQNLSIYAWSHALAAAVISIIIWGVLEKTESVYLNNDNRDLHQQIPPFASQIVSYTLVVAAPMATMTVTYMRLFRRVKMRIRAVGAKRCNLPNTVSQMASQSVVQDGPSVFGAVKPHNMILARPTKQNRRHADLRTAVTLLILLSIFVLCWTPIMVLSLVVSFGSLRDNNSSPIYLTVAAAVVFIIPACNPLVYSMRNAQFRAAACDFLCATGRWMTTPCRRKGRQSEEPVVDN